MPDNPQFDRSYADFTDGERERVRNLTATVWNRRAKQEDERLLMHVRNNMDFTLNYRGAEAGTDTLENVFGENWMEKFELLLRATDKEVK
jgi:hypothetical protein